MLFVRMLMQLLVLAPLGHGLRPSVDRMFSTGEYVLKRAREESFLRFDRLIKNDNDALSQLLQRKEKLMIEKDEWVCVTGATSGIGLEVGAELAKIGYRVVLCGRDMSKLKKAQENAPRSEIVCFDLESLESIAAGAAQIVDICSPAQLKGLVLNAGAWPILLDETEDGLELGLQANYVGQALLADRLISASEPKNMSIVTLSSIAHAGYLNKDLEPILQDPAWRNREFDPNESYAAVKLMAIFYARILASFYKIKAARAVHPGLVPSTELFRAFPDAATFIQTNIPDPLGLLSTPLYQAQSLSSAAQKWATNALESPQISNLLDAAGPLKSSNRAAREIIAILLDPALPKDGPFFCDAQITDPAPIVLNDDADFSLSNRLFQWTASLLDDCGFPLTVTMKNHNTTSSVEPLESSLS
uniref:Protochlorophyllide reductase n=1 Tax=Aureoumbra lagunensis TaxID=44058 RepID=A0A7S3K432_9STRA|mmetsp:Transcript_10809/g.16307  ORF Transcript_10809/g.16307 Transcript_10809/m.16307 type:complete len:417 (+) Transcript_10809:73-1323(+)